MCVCKVELDIHVAGPSGNDERQACTIDSLVAPLGHTQPLDQSKRIPTVPSCVNLSCSQQAQAGGAPPTEEAHANADRS